MNDQKLGLILGRIEQKVDDLKDDVTEVKDELKEGFMAVNGRVCKLEGWRNRILGGFALIAAGIAAAKVLL